MLHEYTSSILNGDKGCISDREVSSIVWITDIPEKDKSLNNMSTM